jgi:hypothetical protein
MKMRVDPLDRSNGTGEFPKRQCEGSADGIFQETDLARAMVWIGPAISIRHGSTIQRNHISEYSLNVASAALRAFPADVSRKSLPAF